MKLKLNFFSQYSQDITKEWQSKICAILCVKMTLDFFGKKVNATDLIKEGLIISDDLSKKGKPQNGYTKKFGWGHDSLLMLLRNRGIVAYEQEFKSFTDGLLENNSLVKFGIKKILDNIKKGFPVIVSIAKNTDNRRLSGHMVIAYGYEEKNGILSGFYINDPEYKTELEGKNIFVKKEDFIKNWKKLAIFTE
jgi:uncharacterized protein YvpB